MIENLFLSVGAMKAGTTWLYDKLKNHPEIYFTPEKEIHYFANAAGIENQLAHERRLGKFKHTLDQYTEGSENYQETISLIEWYAAYAHDSEISNEWYAKLFKNNTDATYCADFSNLYCQMQSTDWNRVREISKNIKVIYTLRDPIQRLWSHYKFHMKWTNREDSVLDLGFDHFKNVTSKPWFWNNSLYSNNYNELSKALDQDELLVLYFEDFRKKPIYLINEVCDFLNLETISIGETTLNKKINASKSFSMPDEWREYSLDKLSEENEKLRELGFWHESWSL